MHKQHSSLPNNVTTVAKEQRQRHVTRDHKVLNYESVLVVNSHTVPAARADMDQLVPFEVALVQGQAGVACMQA